MKFWNPEVIRSTTPLVLAGVGAAIGVLVVVNKDVTEQKATAAFGLAGTAIAGAAGLAQSGKSDSDFSVKQRGEDLEVTTPSKELVQE
ncbi:MAG: hypothetical protein KME10_15175 [Plectolyngbya sp. WJT66-NPBG17]|jgi:hypothetical protein|nr:hypothetical protein [Plectolyngbya sp. WJT66-NPBG17]MBW4526673.1 hypothetical protein [Phormidium tanganyikae FI6-MK23]